MSEGAVPGPGRLRSLDVFRGLVIVLMFVVNLSGDRAAFPPWFGHAGWNGGRHGLWLADVVFPWFLFIVGLAIPFSVHSGRGAGLSPARRMLGALRRGAVLYLLGIVIWIAKSSVDTLVWQNGGLVPKPGAAVTWATFLHWDILPLIGLGVVLGVAAYHLPRWVQVGVVAVVLIGKGLILPDLTATVGLARSEWMAGRTDLDRDWRSFGWVGTLITQGLPASATVVIGCLCGEVVRTRRERAAAWLVGCGIGLAAVGLAWWLVGGVPLSKDLFTPSYVLVCAGSGAAVMGGLLRVLDRGGGGEQGAAGEKGAGGWLWRPCETLGKNAIAIYFVAEITWALVWTKWRVLAPVPAADGAGLAWDGQVLFTALQLHLKWLTTAAAGPWLATGVYVVIYWWLARWMEGRKLYIRV